MLNLVKLTKHHIPLLKRYLGKNTNYCCENTFGFIYLWKEAENLYICEDNGVMYIAALLRDAANFYYPFGDNITAECFEKIERYCIREALPLKFWYLAQEYVAPLQAYFKDRISLVNDRDWADYLYTYQSLLCLKGKKYNTQRNHMNRFAKSYEFEFVQYDHTKKPLLEEFFINYYQDQNKESKLFREEKKVLQFLADNYNDINMPGGLLLVDGKAIGITFGEIVEDTLYVHFEKALKKYNGSYATLNNLFLEMLENPEVKFINREEDIGDEGLRLAKMRLRPVRLVDKYFGEVPNLSEKI